MLSLPKLNESKFSNLSITIVLIIVLLWSPILFGFKLIEFNQTREVSSTLITDRILKICELSTIKYQYSDVVAYKDSKSLTINIPYILQYEQMYGKKGFMIKFNASIKAGVEFLNVERIDKDSCKIVLKPKLFDNVIDRESIYYYDEHDSIFNKLALEEYDVAMINEQKKYEEENKDEILNNAKQNAKIIIEGLMESLGFKRTEIIFN